MKIISTTLAGPGTEQSTIEAIKSVAPYVDAHLVIYDPTTFNREAIEVDYSELRRVIFMQVVWPGRFDRARNNALNAATIHRKIFESDEDVWAFTVDADERIGPYKVEDANQIEKFRSILGYACAGSDCISIRDGIEGYYQPRLFRLPCKYRWYGRVHEAIPIKSERFERLAFYGLPKSAEQSFAKWTRDTEQLSLQVKDDPDDPRWWQYLARCHAALFRYWGLEASDGLAEAAYLRSIVCALVREPKARISRADYELAEWSRYMLARHFHERHEPRSLDALGVLYGIDATVTTLAENPYYAATILAQAGQYENALSEVARARLVMQRNPLSERFGFSENALWRDGDLDTLEQFLMLALGSKNQ